MAKKTTASLLAEGATPMKKKPTELTIADIGILYELSQQATVSVRNVHTISNLMMKVQQYLQENTKG